MAEHAHAVAERLECPRGMPREMFSRLAASYHTKVNNYNRAVSRNLRPQTIADNLRKRDEEHQVLKTILEQWSADLALQEAVRQGNASCTEAIQSLVAASARAATQSTAQHQELLDRLAAIQSALQRPAAASSSSSSTDPLPAHLDEANVVSMDVDEEDASIVDQCFLCMCKVSHGVKLPCCWRGGHIAHTSCYMDLLWQDRYKHLQCPLCKTQFNGFGMFSEDAQQRERYRSFMHSLEIPEDWLSFLLSDDNGTSKEVVLPSGDWTESRPLGRFHRVMKVSSRSVVDADCNPLYFSLIKEGTNDSHTYRLDDILVRGDDIHSFVDRCCQGAWPCTDVTVKVTCFGCRFPFHYNFIGFRKGKSGTESYASFEVTDSHERYEGEDSEDEDGIVDMPLSCIESFQLYSYCPILRRLGRVGEPWSPVEVIGAINLVGFADLRRFWVRSIERAGYTPVLKISSTENGLEHSVEVNDISQVGRAIPPPNSLIVMSRPTRRALPLT